MGYSVEMELSVGCLHSKNITAVDDAITAALFCVAEELAAVESML